jgi:hypothetical protein
MIDMLLATIVLTFGLATRNDAILFLALIMVVGN